MNKHRLFRKRGQGRSFFAVALKDKVRGHAVEGKAKVHDTLNEILSKKKKHGAGLKFY